MNFENNTNQDNNSNSISFGSKQTSEFANPNSLVDRYFTRLGRGAYKYDMFGKEINWVSEDVAVTDDMGKVVFTQKGVKKPDFWSSLALKVVASKYFWGDQAKGEREDSVEKIIGRVSRFIGRQAVKQRYFSQEQADSLRDEIASICLNQMSIFNSPVWFNVGIQEYNPIAGGVSAYVWDEASGKVVKSQKTMDRPQCSACFIQSMEDTMDSIMTVQVAEANLFKAGSGTGTNRSTLRSSKEKLTGGGKSSGPLSFMKGYDAYAGAIKSGGKTRRAAKMEILNVDHPDVIDFIESKQKEEKKAWALIEQGYSGGMNGEAYASIAFQNCNMSVRASDSFMDAVKTDGEWQTKFVKDGKVSDTFKATDILRKIAEGTHICGDPGMQFDTIINKYHTSKVSGRINASNPCSEYMFLDDSACNLASINLMKFLTSEGKFDAMSFKKVVDRFITSMELLVDGSSYPTEKIAQNSHDFRPLGLGYANLGALLMSFGLPYDSDEGRAVSAAITALMCGQAYKASANIASIVGPFPRYAENRDSMLQVIAMHRDHVKDIDVNKIPYDLRFLVNEAWDSWSDAYELGKQYGFRNSQATVLAPTGTIAFMMDCDTTGIEPDIALVKYKVLSGGGMLKIVNRSVGLALGRLGYDEVDVKNILDYINKNDTIEGAPNLKVEHLPVFDCAFKAAKGKRSIHYKGHVLMMAVCQPYISGAISKTINMPESATIEEIMDAYMFAWERGLKAVAIYRENSKRSQPLNVKKTEGEMAKKAEVVTVKQSREYMPQTRKSITHKFELADQKGYLTVGLYDDGRPGEIFVTMAKQGSTVRGLIDAWALSSSMNLQYGVSVNELFGKFRHQKFEPSGFVRNGEEQGELDKSRTTIRTASSIVDYISQFMLNTFGKTQMIEVEIPTIEIPALKEEQRELTLFTSDEGLVCGLCGGSAKRIGNCAIKCNSCNQTQRSGCGE
ncbi:vitamin B12-dependent ribonucleotide reductase [Candidatus Pacearchaeota archaeon]|nr:vitamin B12-dependent ribonucleotide reductase [Candidatus Pacearchaeota archaeon]